MKTNVKVFNHVMAIFMSIAFVCVPVLLWSCSGNTPDKIAQQAYQLRMHGNADSAKTLLEKSLSVDSTAAVVWYELARTKHHIGLGNPRKLFTGFDDLQHTIENAVENDPDNVIYSFYKGHIYFLRAYISIMRDPSTAQEKVKKAIAVYESTLKLKPDYNEILLFLVEALELPENMGGDSTKAETYAMQLKKMDAVFGAKASELLLPENADKVEFWQKTLKEYPGNADIIEQLGKAYLYQGNLEQGENHLEKALITDPEKELLLLDLARFYMMTFHQDTSQAKTVLPKAENAISRYLKTEPATPLKAFALNMLAKIKAVMGSAKEAGSLRAEAEALDPNVSKAFGIPPALLFDKPDEISHYHIYFFRPF